ncbi:DMT family transporter [Janibacter sp. DB-40]|uniref:EamA family transporter n=1 Tax=Janibacter sp. DB-40 TaxID=3028808 RepID=UPI0024064495|nr:DMT family transporter [Janibacter sp. DB-40]
MSSIQAAPRQTPFVLGLMVALLSAATFGSSGTFGSALMATGWSAGAVVTARIVGAALLMVVPAALAMRGHWHLVRRNAGRIVAYGFFAVAGCQFAYFMAVERLSVGVALLLEYLAPVLIVAWIWLRHGRRPSGLTAFGVVAAVLGLVLVLDVFSGAQVDVVGVVWGVLAAVGLVVFFLVSAQEEEALPPIGFAGAGLAVGALVLVIGAALGWLPMSASTEPVELGAWSVPWWVAVVELAVVAGAVAYAAGIASARLLGGTVASFVGLSEVLFSIAFAWVLVDQSMSLVQVLGGVAILAGVVAVKLGEGRAPAARPVPADDVDPAVLAEFGASEEVH